MFVLYGILSVVFFIAAVGVIAFLMKNGREMADDGWISGLILRFLVALVFALGGLGFYMLELAGLT